MTIELQKYIFIALGALVHDIEGDKRFLFDIELQRDIKLLNINKQKKNEIKSLVNSSTMG